MIIKYKFIFYKMTTHPNLITLQNLTTTKSNINATSMITLIIPRGTSLSTINQLCV